MESGSDPDSMKERARILREVTLVLATPAGIAVVLFAFDRFDVFALATLVATCAFAVGGLLGFLFGIPQYLAGQSDPERKQFTYQPNTNLTQVSDWLTKIIIGVGLVQFGQLVDAIGELGNRLGPSLGGGESGDSFAIALVIGFFVIGLLVGYLYTRLKLQQAFAESDRGAFGEREVAEIQRAERVRPLPGDDDGVTVKKRPKSAGIEEISKRIKDKLRFVRKILDWEPAVDETEYRGIAEKLRVNDLITQDEEQFVLELLAGDLDLRGWPDDTAREFLDSAWIFSVRFGSLVWDREVRKRLQASGWFIADFQQAPGHRPDFLAVRNGRWVAMAPRISGTPDQPFNHSVTARRLSEIDPGEKIEGRCVVIPDIREGTVADGKAEQLAAPVKVVKLGTLLSSWEAAFDD